MYNTIINEVIRKMKLIASDLDGTLLNENGEISEENLQAIKRIEEKGIKFVVATGRSYDAANKPFQSAGLSCPFICLNGANTFDLKGQLLHEITMELPICQKIISVCQKADMYIEVFTNQGIYSLSRENYMEIITQAIHTAKIDSTEEDIRQFIEQRFQDEKVQFIHNYEELFSMKDIKVYKILSFASQREELNKANENLKNESGMVITSSGPLNLEFNHPKAQKGIALKNLADKMGIQMKDVMALGDNLNDKSMLLQAGRGVAMGNAAEEIKELCTYITKTNHDNGFAFAIEEMLEEYHL